MATKKVAATKKSAPKSKKTVKDTGTKFSLGDIFSFSTMKTPKGGEAKNFSSSFEYHKIKVDIKGSIKNGEGKLNIKIDGKEAGFNGVITISERAVKGLSLLFSHLLDNLKKH